MRHKRQNTLLAFCYACWNTNVLVLAIWAWFDLRDFLTTGTSSESTWDSMQLFGLTLLLTIACWSVRSSFCKLVRNLNSSAFSNRLMKSALSLMFGLFVLSILSLSFMSFDCGGYQILQHASPHLSHFKAHAITDLLGVKDDALHCALMQVSLAVLLTGLPLLLVIFVQTHKQVDRLKSKLTMTQDEKSKIQTLCALTSTYLLLDKFQDADETSVALLKLAERA